MSCERENFGSGMTHNSKPQQAELQRCDGGDISITAFRFSLLSSKHLRHLSSSGIKLALKSCENGVSIRSSREFFLYRQMCEHFALNPLKFQ